MVIFNNNAFVFLDVVLIILIAFEACIGFASLLHHVPHSISLYPALTLA